MALEYRLEFVFDDSQASDASAFIHLRVNPPIYQSHIDKEDYDILPSEEKHAFLTGLFNVAGVTELSSRAFRVWLMKSPSYTWQEVMEPALYFIASSFGESEITSMPGSAQPNGTGTTLTSVNNRRPI